MRTANSNNKTLRESLDRAIGLKRQRKNRQAIQILLLLSRQYPRSATVHGLLGGTYFELDDMGKAANAFTQAIRLNPKSELASLGLFHSLWERNQRHQAFAEMRRFLSIAPSEQYTTLLRDLAIAGQIAPRGAA
jgi:tetratricopeptide (TPR) repeat protein